MNDSVLTNSEPFSVIPFGSTGQTSEAVFLEFENSICPMYCPLIKICDGSQYDLICDTANDGNFGIQTMIESTITSDEIDPDSEKPIYDVHLSSVDPDVIGNVYQCKIQGTLNGSTAVSDSFPVEFSPCS